MKKRLGKLLGAFLCLSMILGLMPAQALQVLAVEEPAPNYLTFTAEEANSTISLKWYSGENVQYSTDRGSTWIDYDEGTVLTLVNERDTVSFKGKNVAINNPAGYDNGPGFTMTGKIGASGSVTSLLDENGGDPYVKVPVRGLGGLFKGCASLTSAPELPALRLSERCYYYMFADCTSLQTAPKLPATNLETYCYGFMFKGCTSLTSAPELPAMTMEKGCYNQMFSGCRSLAMAPKLPATSMANYCYGQMFESCTSLKTIPDLPATSLVSECYFNMFLGCSGISVSQQKDATHTLAWTFPDATGSSWGGNMFTGCDVDFGNDKAYPEINTTYYQLCTHSYGSDKKCIYCGEEETKTYSVTIIAGEGLTRDPYRGAEQQMVQDKIEDVYYTADEDHYIQDDYPTITKNGITVARYVLEGWGPVVIVSGRPTADTVITLPEASACNVPPSPESKPNPEKPVMKDGDNGQHIIGKTETLTFRSSAPLDQFVAVFVDDIMVDSSNYELESGSTIVRLKQAFLDTLSKGSHTIAIQSTGGTATANFMVAEASGSGSGNGGGNGGTTGTGTGSGTGSTTSAPAEGITNVQPACGTQTAQDTSSVTTNMDVASPETGDASLVSCIVLAIIIVGGFGLMIVELCRTHRMKKNIQS